MKTAKEYLLSKYPNISPDWFDDNELTQEMIQMMQEYAEEYHSEKMKEEEIEEKPMLCDVSGCKNISDNGGIYWKETGYWRLCYDHFMDGLHGLPQPKMRKEAIKRESNRDKVTGFLNSVKK
jgi:hypothetical protein